MAALLYGMNESPVPVRVARYLLLSTVIVPLIVVASLFFPYIVPRTIFFRTVVELTVAIFIYLLATRDWRIRTHVDLFFWGLAAFVGASALSALFSPARNRAMFGDFERMGGVWALLHYLMFYALLRVFFRPKEWTLFANLSLGVSAVVSAIAIYEGSHRSGAVSTVGNSGLLALYLFFGVGLAVYLAFRVERKWLKPVFALAALLNIYAIVLSHNRSSLLGLAVAAAVAGAVYFFLGAKHRKAIAALGLVLVVSFGLALTLVIKAPDSWAAKHMPGALARVGASEANRLVLWNAALEGFRDRPLVGYGPENFHLAWSANFQPKVYSVTTEQRVDRAHNIMLEVLSTTGVIGFVAFLAMWAALFFSVSAGLREKVLTLSEGTFFVALSAGYLIALGFWFIDVNSFVPWIALTAFLASKLSGGQVMEFESFRPMELRTKLVLGGAFAAIAASLWLHTFETVRVSRLLYRTQIAQSDMPTTLHLFFKVFDSPAPQSTHTPYLFGRYMGWLVPRLNKHEMSSSTRPLLDTAFAQGIVEMEKERKRDPRNELIYLQQARLALLASAYYGHPGFYNHAVKSLEQAVQLSPKRVQPKLVMAYTLMMGKQFDEAEIQLRDAQAIYPQSGQIYYYLGELYRLRGDPLQARAALDTSLNLGHHGSPDVYLAVLGALQGSGKYSDAAELGEAYLGAVQPGYRPAGVGKLVPKSPTVIRVLARLPWLWAKAGNRDRVVGAVQNFKAAYPTGAASADQFLKNFIAGNETTWQRDSSLLPSARD